MPRVFQFGLFLARSPPSLRTHSVTKMFANPYGRHASPRGAATLHRLSGLLAAALVCAIFAPPRVSGQTTSDEYRVKAAFLFHFAQLVEWPAGAFTQDENDLSVCTIGGDPFEGQLESVLLGKVVGSRTLKVKHLKTGDGAKSCRILFIAMVDAKQVASLISELGNAPVLTVGQTDSFAHDGGIIGFCLEDGKVRFQINLTASQRAGIKISSRLLLLAKNVIANQG